MHEDRREKVIATQAGTGHGAGNHLIGQFRVAGFLRCRHLQDFLIREGGEKPVGGAGAIVLDPGIRHRLRDGGAGGTVAFRCGAFDHGGAGSGHIGAAATRHGKTRPMITAPKVTATATIMPLFMLDSP